MPYKKSNVTAAPLLFDDIDRGQPIPLYYQIFVRLRDQIFDGAYKEGSRLPGEHDISRIFHVSGITAKRALNEIEAAGLAVRQAGRGTIVLKPPGSMPVRRTVDNLVASLGPRGNGTSARVREIRNLVVPREIGKQLKLAPGTKVLKLVRVWLGDRGPRSHVTAFVPTAIAQQWPRSDLERKSLAALFEERGIRVSHVEEVITATLAETAVAEGLDVPASGPLLTIVRIIYDQNDQPTAYIRAHYPPDRYRYSISFHDSPWL